MDNLKGGVLLEAKNLSCGYGKEEVIKNISFFAGAGDFLGIIGPNGTGKTTLFRAITGVLEPSSGEVVYKNKNILKISARDFAREVAVMPQIQDIAFPFSVEEFVLMGRFPHLRRFEPLQSNDYEVLEEVLALADIPNLRERKISELSGGERQRVILAQGLAQQPSLLLLDEPTLHLDIAHQIQILDLIKRLNRQKGTTVLVILHDLNLASNYCDRLILLKEGSIFKDGSPYEVLTFKNIEEVYKTVVVVEKNPISSRPYIFLVPENQRRKRGE